MLCPAFFRDVVSGRRRGLGAMLLRGLLWLLKCPYSWAVRFRNWQYDVGWRKTRPVELPVVSVGNLTLGGTGKTPLVEYLARWFRQRDIRVAIISRGYGAAEGGPNDEALELEQKLPDVPHLQNPDRVAAAQVAHDELDMQLLILDDAFQHRRIVRDLDVVLLDALEPYGLGHVFPRGTLREPLSSLRRADVVALSRADAVTAKRREEIRAKIHRFAPEATWIELEHRPQYLLAATGERATLDELRGKSVAAFCGIGNPAGFRHTLAGSGANVTAWREFPDHHNYDRADIEELGAWLQEQPEVEVAVCTHKDLVKIGVPRLTGKPLYALVIGVGVSAGAEDLGLQLQQIASQIERPRRSR